MKIRIAASILMKPFQPVLKALPIAGLEVAFGGTTALATGSGLSVSFTRNVASDTRSESARFMA
jgi:hypothetical protein